MGPLGTIAHMSLSTLSIFYKQHPAISNNTFNQLKVFGGNKQQSTHSKKNQANSTLFPKKFYKNLQKWIKNEKISYFIVLKLSNVQLR